MWYNGFNTVNNKKKQLSTGIISITSKGVGYVTIDGLEDDVLIEPQFLNTALHGDEVEVVLFPQAKGERLSGEAVRILKRAKMQFVGAVDKRKGSAISFVVCDDKRMYVNIFIPPSESRKIKNNDKVLVRIKNWDDPKKNPEGEIIKVLGKKGDNDVEMESIILEKGFQMAFPPKIEEEAKMIAKRAKPIPEKDIAKRRDFRDIATFTIDPEDAKDFDDALSFRKISEDVFEIGVHIADVSHYVREGGALDKEALHRGVSIYLVDRTIPMLPEALSNDICSLKPREDRLAFSVVMDISADGGIQKIWFGKTIINSNKRFTYEEAQNILDGKEGEYRDELVRLNKLARLFRKKRMENGALDFDRDEVKFILDAKGKPVTIVKKRRLDAHKLVEEFMILANREVASHLSKEIEKINKGASVFRVHGVPKQEAVNKLLLYLKVLGHTIEVSGQSISSKELNDIFEKIKGEPEEALVKNVAMSSMAKAVYSTKNSGHYGLALVNYTHFTSPIRRYADLLVHRILEKHLKGEWLSAEEVERYRLLAAQLSAREIGAVDAERSSISYKQVEYMSERVGEIYEGKITGVTKWGIYVEESQTNASGMIRMRDMKDDFYIFDKTAYSIVGQRTKRRYSVGDKVKIKVAGADVEKKLLDYVLV